MTQDPQADALAQIGISEDQLACDLHALQTKYAGSMSLGCFIGSISVYVAQLLADVNAVNTADQA